MSEIVTSILNKNSLLYGSGDARKDFGPGCIDRKGEEVKVGNAAPTEAPIKAVREK